MARIRTVKPDFFTHEGLADFSAAHRILFIGLWTMADRVGRLQDRPRRIKAAIFPYDEIIDAGVVDQMLADLQAHSEGFLIRYEQDGLACIQINAFLRHQRPTEREPDSELPPPTNWQRGSTKRASPSAEQLLKKLLDDGPRLASEIRLEATRIGISERSLRRARATLGVSSTPAPGDSRRKIWARGGGHTTGQLSAEYRQVPAKVSAKIADSESRSNVEPSKRKGKSIAAEVPATVPNIPAKHRGKGREVVEGKELVPSNSKEEKEGNPPLSREDIESIFGTAGSGQVAR